MLENALDCAGFRTAVFMVKSVLVMDRSVSGNQAAVNALKPLTQISPTDVFGPYSVFNGF